MTQHTELIARLRKYAMFLENKNDLDFFQEILDLRESADALQALERVPMTPKEVNFLLQRVGILGNLDTLAEIVRATEAHHGITPPESKG